MTRRLVKIIHRDRIPAASCTLGIPCRFFAMAQLLQQHDAVDRIVRLQTFAVVRQSGEREPCSTPV